MLHSKGASAPFFLSMCAPRLRDDALLTRAIDAFESGDYADALLAAEVVCHRFPTKEIPAILRAKILHVCRPELAAKAWYRAWLCNPENAVLQDAMLNAWLKSGATASVADLGSAFLPERCRAGNHTSLIPLLHQANVTQWGACWKSGSAIEGMLFNTAPAPMSGALNSSKVRLILSDQTSHFEYEVPADGRRFKLPCPRASGVWSLAFAPLAHARDAATAAAPLQLLHGSPLVFAPTDSVTQPECSATVPQSPRRTENSHRTEKTALQQKTVDILIPVYRDHARVKACIDSVLLSLPQNSTPGSVIVIDDASPEPALSAWLDTLAAAGHIVLLRNPLNLGFIETVNRGLRQHAEHDVVLLNADTLVQGDWLDRLRSALYSAPDIASVTPWSNNGEISSFPKIATAAPPPTLAQLARIDNSAAELRRANRTADVELPACCGFAMVLRRSVLDEIGLLDGVALVRGYGEEVDWCLRARAAGYRHLAATGVFVAHSGTVSFRFEKTLRVRQNRAVIAARYPRYYPEFQRFIKDDPLKVARTALQLALTQANSDWLNRAIGVVDKKSEFAAVVSGTLPPALPSSCARLAVWQHQASDASAPKILALARAIASHRPPLALRLLLIGETSEALWHTGVVDGLPSSVLQESPLLTDAALVGLSGCALLLTEKNQTVPLGIPQVQLDEEFEPLSWLADWLSQQASDRPTSPYSGPDPESKGEPLAAFLDKNVGMAGRTEWTVA
jgi:GT2 family glycosyltransferase